MTPQNMCGKRLFYSGYAADSRLCRQGDLFFALNGEKTDGHSFLGDAAKRGARAAVVQKGYQGSDFGMELHYVECPLTTLQDLAREKIADIRKPIVGVTGTVGKTTCKEFLVRLLEGTREVSFSPDNQNSQVSLPLTILNHCGWGEDVVILEMGMSKPGEISRLVDIAPPHIAVVTAITLVHAENFDSLDGIAHAKGEILCHPETKLGLIPDHPVLQSKGTCKKKVVSLDKQEESSAPCIAALASLSLPRHHQHNALIAATVCLELGLTPEQILPRFPLLQVPKGRGTLLEKGGVLYVDDSYNASPEAVKAALNALPKASGKKIAVLGEMKELGKFSEEAHLSVGSYALDKLDLLIGYGPEAKVMADLWVKKGRRADWYDSRSETLDALKASIEPGDVVLIKGSNSCRLWELLEAL